MTTVKPETVSIYQVKKTEKDTYKKRTNWRLKDLKLIDGKDETNVSNISNTQDGVSSDIQKQSRELKIQRLAEYF